jgi:hypothetical protein
MPIAFPITDTKVFSLTGGCIEYQERKMHVSIVPEHQELVLLQAMILYKLRPTVGEEHAVCGFFDRDVPYSSSGSLKHGCVASSLLSNINILHKLWWNSLRKCNDEENVKLHVKEGAPGLALTNKIKKKPLDRV